MSGIVKVYNHFLVLFPKLIEISDALIPKRTHQQRRNFFWILNVEFVAGIVYMYMIGTAFLGSQLMNAFLMDKTFPSKIMKP